MAAARARSHRPGLSSSPGGSDASRSAWILAARSTGERGMLIGDMARSAAIASTSCLSSWISSARKVAGSSSASASTRKPPLSRKPHSALPVWGQPRLCSTASTPVRIWSRVSMAAD